ncbi:DNA primase [Variovorax sp. WDL1]|nr:DNA primase [Variovorax sp. WDL1]
MPDAIERHYLHVDDRYFFPDRTLAFIDDGDRIRVRTDNREVLHSVVAIAEARGWRVIGLKGTDAFRHGMWREAALRGIEARGYEPNPAEVLQVQRALKKWQPSHETAQGPPPRAASTDRTAASARDSSAPTDSAEPSRNAGSHPPEATQDSRSLREGPRPPVTGMLVAAAAAPYQFDPAQRMSFYVMVRTEVGDRTVWGADLERALAESASQPRIGDQVVLTQRGTRPVNVRVPARNAEGELVGERKIVAQRARWAIETSDHLREMERRAGLVRTGQLLSDAALDQHPVLATVAAGLKLAEQFARRVTADQTSQQHLVEMIRERMADALARGQEIHLPDRRTPPSPMQVRQRTGRGREELSHERF